jgi:hypothetical protein
LSIGTLARYDSKCRKDNYWQIPLHKRNIISLNGWQTKNNSIYLLAQANDYNNSAYPIPRIIYCGGSEESCSHSASPGQW